MTLEPHHAKLIADSGITLEVAEARGYRSVTDRHELLRLSFKPVQARPGLVIPLFDVFGKNGNYQLRPDEPRFIHVSRRVIKYETPTGSSLLIDVHPFVRGQLPDPSVPLWFTEGVRKGDAGVSHGIAIVSFLGVYSWRGKNPLGGKTALADFEAIALNGRRTYVVYDSDIMLKREVRQALERLVAFLRRRGAEVFIVYLPSGPSGAKVGLDDYFAAGHTVEDLLACAREDVLNPPSTEERGFRCTDLGNAERLVALHGADLRYGSDVGWLSYDEHRGQWLRDPEGLQAQRRAQLTVREIRRDAAAEQDPERRAELARWAQESERSARIAAMCVQARSAPRLAVHAGDLDANPYLLNVRNGTIDLRNGLLGPHRREELHTRLSPVHYNPDATCPTWLAFLDRIMDGRADLIAFLQRAVGYALTGLTGEQVMFMLYGTGANGKSTFLETLRAMLGDYTAQTSFDTFLVHDRDSIRNDLARLAGVRLVSANEVEAGKRLSEVTIKQLTGGDRVTARFLHREFFEFEPTFKLFLSMNDKPRIMGTDEGIWRRIRLVPFIVTIPEAERDRQLAARLRVESPGILAWAVQGCLEWQQRGLAAPEDVQEATRAYREEMDALAGFLGECCVIGPRYRASAADLYEAYKTYAERNGDDVMKQRWFGLRLGERGFENRRDSVSGRIFWHGIGVKTAGSGETGERGEGYSDSILKDVKDTEPSPGHRTKDANMGENPEVGSVSFTSFSRPAAPGHCVRCTKPLPAGNWPGFTTCINCRGGVK